MTGWLWRARSIKTTTPNARDVAVVTTDGRVRFQGRFPAICSSGLTQIACVIILLTRNIPRA